MPGRNENQEIIYQVKSNAHSEVNDLIGSPPGWLLKSGISMIALTTIVILLGSYFFKFPDKLIGHGILTSSTPPIEIISRTAGYIESINFREGSKVRKGDAILHINNTTNPAQILQLEEWIKKYQKIEDPKRLLNLKFIEDLQLGIIQDEYANLQLRYNELQLTLKDGLVFQQINNLSREIDKIRALNISQEKEKELYAQELELSSKDFDRNEILADEGVISSLELERAKTTLLQKERHYEGMNNSIIRNNIKVEQLSLEKLELQQERQKTIQDYQFNISEILARIKSSIESWTMTYIVEAPIDGTVAYTKDISYQSNLSNGQIIGYIIPSENKDRYISTILPSYNIGKVKSGQKVILKFDAYPHKEFGVVVSTVEEISKVPELDSKEMPQYELRVPIQDVIITDYNDTIAYKPKMSVVAEVVTEDKTLFDRIFDQLISIIKFE